MTMTQLFMLCKLLEMEDKVVASFFLSYLREVPGELFEGVGDDDLVVGERGAEDVELKLVEAVGEDPLGARERPRGLDHVPDVARDALYPRRSLEMHKRTPLYVLQGDSPPLHDDDVLRYSLCMPR